jgi:uncharacterized RmlC-like cupin family protein
MGAAWHPWLGPISAVAAMGLSYTGRAMRDRSLASGRRLKQEVEIKMSKPEPIDWKVHGVKVIPGNALDPNTAQTPGMRRAAAINYARVGAQRIWAGTVSILPNAKTGAHHHGPLESVIYVVKGHARMRWGDHLEYTAEAGPGDFIYVPPYAPHQEINASTREALECVLVRSDNEAVVVNLDIEPVEKPETVPWIDPIHRDE